MKKTYITFCLFIAIISIVFNSCSKDDKSDTVPNNPINGQSTAVFNPGVTYGTMTDREGNIYKTVTIGTQTWMAENLRTTKYNDGTVIPNITDDAEWEALKTGAYCNYNYTKSTDTIATYGRLYNWYAVNTRKLAPAGWHVPTDAEWATLIDYLGGIGVAGGKLKETGIKHWNSSNSETINESGFTALPNGFCTDIGTFYDFGWSGFWWSASEANPDKARTLYVSLHYSDVFSSIGSKNGGISVRCVKD
jgi:uncharacterized protein (TIGR02145 family)